MNVQDNTSALPVDINPLKTGHRRIKNEHQKNTFRAIKVDIAAEATEATVISKIASSSIKPTEDSVSLEVTLTKASKATEAISVEVSMDTENKATKWAAQQQEQACADPRPERLGCRS